MFNKKFVWVAFFLFVLILVVLFGKSTLKSLGSVKEISNLTEATSLGYYKKACNYEHAEVCNKLGDMYHYGNDMVSIDYEDAVEYYKKACELEDGRGCNNLAYMLNTGKGRKMNNWTAIRLYKKACKLGEMEACYNVGSMYFNGEGTRRNYANAVYFFEKSCNNGIAAGCNNLGYMHEQGKYLSASITKALSYYANACDMGSAAGCKNLAYLREQKGHLKPAKQFYIKACTLGDNYSCNRLENFLGQQIYEIKDEVALKEAKNACKLSTQGGTMCYRVGLYYEKQGEVEKARLFFEKACDRQQSQSCKHLGDLHR